MANQTNRRTFIRHIAAAGALLPTALPRLARAQSPNNKVNIAAVGTAARAGSDIAASHASGLANYVAFADVDSGSLGKVLDKYPGANGYEDYRVMLDKEQKNIDAVICGTPDHQHAQVALRAMNLGKHLYCEKPLAHTVHETSLMKEAAKRNKVVTQMGTQIHSSDNYQTVVNKIQDGVIGKIDEVHVWIYGGLYHGAKFPAQPSPIPASLNWDLWLGPAADRPYYKDLYHPFNWRGWWDFGGGGVSDFACHYMDLPHWALGLRHPHTVRATGAAPVPLRTTKNVMLDFHYPNRGNLPPVKLTWHLGGTHVDKVNVYEKFGFTDKEWKGSGILFKGEKGVLVSNYIEHMLLPSRERFKPGPAKGDLSSQYNNTSNRHHREWLNGITQGAPTRCNFDYSGSLTETVLLGIVANRAGNVEFKVDPKTLRPINNPKAAAFCTKYYRKGWDINAIA